MLARLALPFALLGALAVLLLTVAGGAAFPGYSHLSQYISELGARGAPHEALVRFAGFLPAGVFLCLFVVAALGSLPRSHLTSLALLGLAVYAGGYIAAAVFPCDPGCRPAEPSAAQLAHNLFGLAGYVLAPWFLLALAWRARSWPGAGPLATLGFVASAVVLVGLLTLEPSSPFAGLSQRAIEASVLLWIVLCAAYIRSRAARAA